MTWREVITRGGDYLVAKGIDDGHAATEFLAARLLHIGRGMLTAHLDESPDQTRLDAMRRGVKRLANNEPLQYILGEWDFRSLTLKCDRRALIPRPETEGLVSLALDFLTKRHSRLPAEKPPVIIDVGTGTGAIALSIAKELPFKTAVIATDISPDAISLAKENAVKTGLGDKVRFVAMDGLDDFDDPGIIDLIVSNPPYISTAEMAGLERRVADFEPRIALDGGPEGLDFYDRYLADALNLLAPGGAVCFEIGAGQGKALRQLLEAYGFSNISISKDLAGNDRYAFGVLT